MLETNFRQWENETLQKGIILGRTEGRAEGKAEGRIEGRAEGKIEGRIEGKAEEREESLRKSIVRLHKIGLSNDQIILAIIEDFDLSQAQAHDKILQYLN